MAKGGYPAPLNNGILWLRKDTLTENPGPTGWGLGMGTIPPSRKKLSITETGNSNKQCYMGSSTTTCLTPNDDFVTWEDGLVTGAGVSRKEACSLWESLASPKSIMKIERGTSERCTE